VAALAPALSVSTYAGELEKAQSDVSALHSIALRDARDAEKRIRLAYRQYHLASLTNRPVHFAAVEQSITGLLLDFGPKEDICLLKANVDGRFHRLAGVKEALRQCPSLAAGAAGRAISADVDFQEGRYEDARATLSALIEDSPTWDNLARLAHWHSKLGDREAADRLYESAEDELTAKEMRSFAWLELQRGELALSRGDVDKANVHAARAAASYPGHWKSAEFKAKVLATAGRLDQAAALLETVAADQSRPELHQAIGELLAALGRAEDARSWFDSALSDYLASALQGEVHYFHHLADFYADSGARPAEGVKWARKDLALRENFSTQSMLAWALYRNGEVREGLHWIKRALSSGAQESALFATAAALYGAAGNPEREAEYELAARRINPLRPAVHLHL